MCCTALRIALVPDKLIIWVIRYIYFDPDFLYKTVEKSTNFITEIVGFPFLCLFSGPYDDVSCTESNDKILLWIRLFSSNPGTVFAYFFGYIGVLRILVGVGGTSPDNIYNFNQTTFIL